MYDFTLKYKAIVHYKHFLKSIRKVSQLYQVSKTTLHRWLKEGQVTVRKSRMKKQVRSDIASCIDKAISKNPFCSLKELAHQISSSCNVKYSPSTVSRIMKSCKMSYKTAKRCVNYKHDTSYIQAFCQAFLENNDKIVCIDELGFYVGENPRKGWAKIGTRLQTPLQPSMRLKKFSVIVAISSQGIEKYSILESNCKKEDFIKFCDELELPSGTKILMDNIPFHKSSQVQKLLDQRNIITLFTPPYSPRTNPIENLFGVIKSKYRKQCPVTPNSQYSYKLLFESILQQHMLSDLQPFYDRVSRFLEDTLHNIQLDPTFRFSGYG